MDAANEVLLDPGFQERVEAMSELMGLQRHSPLEDVVWLMEYVARTRGAGMCREQLRRWVLLVNVSIRFDRSHHLRLIDVVAARDQMHDVPPIS